MNTSRLLAVRASICHCLSDPGSHLDGTGSEYFADGLMLIADGRVEKLGPAVELLPQLPEQAEVHDYSGQWIVPGLIDTHIHYPQTDMIACYGEQLLEWLRKYTFPTEARFGDPEHAAEVAEFFIDELLRNGTTTALVLATVHPQSADAIFAAAKARGMRLIAGKVLMDRNAPDNLQDTAESGYRDSKALIERWHGHERLLYAITPRFAGTSSEQQLELTARLAKEYPDTYVHTHVAENRAEVRWMAELFPWSRSYLDIYDRYGLLRERSVYAHCIHLDEQDRNRMGATGAAVSFCPTSNLFLGSGLFDIAAADRHGIRIGIGSDVGAGTSFSQLRTLSEAYKIAQLNGQSLSPYRALYFATLGGAKSLYLDDRIGNFALGKEADFIVLDPQATPLLARRLKHGQDPADVLFVSMMLGDDRMVAASYVMGQAVYRKAA